MRSDDWRAPRRLHPLSPIVMVARNPVGFGFAAALAVVTGDVVFLVFLVGLAVTAVVGYLRRRWWFDGSTLHLRTGLVAITERSLSVDRVQQVDLREPLVARMLGLAVVSVESASGSAGADIELSALDITEARRLRQAILTARARQVDQSAAARPVGDGEVAAPPPLDTGEDPDAPPVASLPFGELVLGGLIGAESLAAGLAAAIGALAFGAEIITSRPSSLDNVTVAGSIAVVALVVAFLAIATVSAIASMVLGYAEFRLTKAHGEIRLRRGLLERREESTPVHRVQVATVTETPPQRGLDRVGIRLRAAGTPGKESAGRLRIPIWHLADVARLLEELVPGLGRTFGAPLEPAPPAARRRAVVQRMLVISVPAAVCAWAALAASPWWAVPTGVLLGGAWVWGLAAHRALGLVRHRGVVGTRRGVLIRRTDLAPDSKVQSTRVRSTPFQRRLGLATVHLDVAGTDAVRIPDRAAAEAMALAAELGHGMQERVSLR